MPPYSPQRSPRKKHVYSTPHSPSKSPLHRTHSIKSPVTSRLATPKSPIWRNAAPSLERRSPDEQNRYYSSITLEEFLTKKERQNDSKNEVNKYLLCSKQQTSSTQFSQVTDSWNQKIQVYVRKRPLTKNEISLKEKDITYLSGMRTIDVLEPKSRLDLTQYTEPHSFTFDEVFDASNSNRTIYQKTTRPLVEYMFEGGKSTCFAFGQTGSGKTYTMLDSKHGLCTQAVMDIFRLLNKECYSHLTAWIGYYEIYQGQLYDLLDKRKKLIPRDDGKGNVVIAGLKEFKVHDVDALMKVCEYGNRERTTNKTKTNQTSSRSHAILQIYLKNNNIIHGKLNFIDLAGSERGADRGKNIDSKIRMEGAEINRSLLALKECIRALNHDQKHAPFRGSKLTMVLRDSFVGNSKTCMIATISPNTSNSNHTLNTLRYADRIKEFRGEADSRLICSDAQAMPNIENVDFKNENSNDTASPQITKDYIRNFMSEHYIEVCESEEYLTMAKKMRNDIDSIPMDSYDFPDKYRSYLNNLNRLLKKKINSIQTLQNKIKEELCSDDE